MASADEVLDEYIRRRAFAKLDDNGYPYLDTYEIHDAVQFGLGRKLRSAERWQATIDSFERDQQRLHNYDRHYNRQKRWSLFDEHGQAFEIYPSENA